MLAIIDKLYCNCSYVEVYCEIILFPSETTTNGFHGLREISEVSLRKKRGKALRMEMPSGHQGYSIPPQ